MSAQDLLINRYLVENGYRLMHRCHRCGLPVLPSVEHRGKWICPEAHILSSALTKMESAPTGEGWLGDTIKTDWSK